MKNRLQRFGALFLSFILAIQTPVMPAIKVNAAVANADIEMSEAAENEGSATLPDDKTDTVVNEQEVSSDSAIEITEDKSVTTSELSDSDSVVSESAVENVPTETTSLL